MEKYCRAGQTTDGNMAHAHCMLDTFFFFFFFFFFSSPLALQPAVGFGLSNNIPPFFPICHQLSPSMLDT
jgi:hypothetical protein